MTWPPWLIGRLTSVPVLATLLVVMTVLSAGPLHPLDTLANTPNALRADPEVREFLIFSLDEIASRFTVLPILGVLTLFLALRRRSWRPILMPGFAVAAMIAIVALMKLLLARGHPRAMDPSFFQGVTLPWQNVSFPSGHAANAVLIYGIAVYLLVYYGNVSMRTGRRLLYGVAAIALLQSAVSLFLRFHWFTDLATGMVVGALVLRTAIEIDRRLLARQAPQAPDNTGESSPHEPESEYQRPVPVPEHAASSPSGIRQPAAAPAERRVNGTKGHNKRRVARKAGSALHRSQAWVKGRTAPSRGAAND